MSINENHVALTALLFSLPLFSAHRALGQPVDLEEVMAEMRRTYQHLNTSAIAPVRPQLTKLISARFEATTAICTEIDRADNAAETNYVAALYRALGRVKDPGSIGWLGKRLDTPSRKHIYNAWLPAWNTRLFGSFYTHTYITIKWMEKPKEWFHFLEQLFFAARSPVDRIRVLVALTRCFHDDYAIQYFVDAEARLTGEELLIAQAYLLRHGRTVDEGRLRTTIKELRKSAGGSTALYRFARDGRHPAIVPWLLQHLEHGEVDSDAHPWEALLRKITLRYDLSGNEAWQRWWVGAKGTSRDAWLASALDKVEVVLAEDPSAAARILMSVLWNESSITGRATRWAEHAELHPALARWIVLSYEHYRRGEFEPIARRIVTESWRKLDGFGQRGLNDLDFGPTGERSWRQTVRRE